MYIYNICVYIYIYIYASQWFDPILDIDINIFENKTAKLLRLWIPFTESRTAALDWEGSTSV